MTAPTTRAEVCRYAAARLRSVLADASTVPWSTTGPSNRYAGIVAPARRETPAEEIDGYGGELVAESVLAGNGNLILALSAAAVPILAILDNATGDLVTDAELALARGILDAGEVGWTRNRRATREEIAAAVRAAGADIVDADIVDGVCDAPLHPPTPDDVEPCGIRCVLELGHEEYHFDGTGNRWAP